MSCGCCAPRSAPACGDRPLPRRAAAGARARRGGHAQPGQGDRLGQGVDHRAEVAREWSAARRPRSRCSSGTATPSRCRRGRPTSRQPLVREPGVRDRARRRGAHRHAVSLRGDAGDRARLERRRHLVRRGAGRARATGGAAVQDAEAMRDDLEARCAAMQVLAGRSTRAGGGRGAARRHRPRGARGALSASPGFPVPMLPARKSGSRCAGSTPSASKRGRAGSAACARPPSSRR